MDTLAVYRNPKMSSQLSYVSLTTFKNIDFDPRSTKKQGDSSMMIDQSEYDEEELDEINSKLVEFNPVFPGRRPTVAYPVIPPDPQKAKKKSQNLLQMKTRRSSVMIKPYESKI